MISIKKLKEIVKKEKIRISKEAIEIIDKILKNKTEDIIRTAKRNAGYFGRKTIKAEDIKI